MQSIIDSLGNFLVSVGTFFTALGAVGALILSWMNKTKITQVHTELNSRLTELVSAVRSSSHAEGVTEGAERERRRQAISQGNTLDPPPEKG